ncbi:MAG: O-antigen ligase family protein [bacterium]|nr:O-antigen ligase family protein [bacterium]
MAGLLWLSYTLHGMRSPFEPLLESDSNSGGRVRQVLFTVCGLAAWYALLTGGHWRKILQCRMAWLGFGLLLAMSAAYSDEPVLTGKRSAVFAMGSVAVLGLTYLARAPHRLLNWGLAGSMGLMAWVSLAMWIALPENCWQTTSRAGLAGVSGHPNTLGPGLAIGWIASLGLAGSGRAVRCGVRALQAGMLSALVLTDSAGSILMAAGGTVGFFWLVTTPMWRVLVAIVVMLFVPLVLFDWGPIVDGSLGMLGRDATLSGRGDLWSVSWREVQEQPWLGSGYGAFWYEGRGRDMVGTWNPRQSHHAYIDLALDVGLIGAFLFAAVVGRALARGWRSFRTARGREARAMRAAPLAVVGALLGIGAFSESFLLKMDKLQFFVFAWCVLVMASQSDRGCRGLHRTMRVDRDAASVAVVPTGG